MAATEYKRVAVKRFAPIEERETPEARYWSRFTLPVTQKLVRLARGAPAAEAAAVRARACASTRAE